MHKVQASLLAVNVGVLALFVVGVAVIVHTEEPNAPPAIRPMVRGERAEDGLVVAAPVDVEPSTARVCEKSTTGCTERSVLAPILFAFLAGGIMNLPEVTALPCI